MGKVPFYKMHGLGNDFVVLDQRRDPVAIGAAAARALADRHTGIGCDQVLLLEPPRDKRAQVFMRILNPDGSEAEACGNGTRCVAQLLGAETGKSEIQIKGKINHKSSGQECPLHTRSYYEATFSILHKCVVSR